MVPNQEKNAKKSRKQAPMRSKKFILTKLLPEWFDQEAQERFQEKAPEQKIQITKEYILVKLKSAGY